MRGEGFWGEEGFCWGMETGKNLGKYWGFYRIASLPQLKKAPAPGGLSIMWDVVSLGPGRAGGREGRFHNVGSKGSDNFRQGVTIFGRHSVSLPGAGCCGSMG